MPTPTIAEYLNFANLQMAAEALYDFDATLPEANLTPGAPYRGVIDPVFLQRGNLHASRFTATEAARFVSQWEVVEHISNTRTGFSGTLFRNITTNELVLSFRSTELKGSASNNVLISKIIIQAGGLPHESTCNFTNRSLDVSFPRRLRESSPRRAGEGTLRQGRRHQGV